MADLAIVGAGWAGLAAAVEAVQRGHRVTLLEMAPQAGGRARSQSADAHGLRLDNGQHILIGAYTATLDLMRHVGADPDRLLQRLPLTLVDAHGRGLRMPTGPALPAFGRGVLAHPDWPLSARLALLRAATGWLLRGFRCAPELTVAELCAALPAPIRLELIEPLCVAALNTPADQASGTIFLRVLRDALFAGPGAADLLLPRAPLAALLPEPALAWLQMHGAQIRLRQRVQQLQRHGSGWQLDGSGEPFQADTVILACSAAEAARLADPHAPDWAAAAGAFGYEPIITVTLRCYGARLAAPMVRLDDGPQAPAQFIFDQQQIQGQAGAGLYTLVVSGAAPWLARTQDDVARAAIRQAGAALQPQQAGRPIGPIELVQLITEKRATFRCTPDLLRPTMRIGPGLLAAGDYIDGPYPATLEGAVRAGLAAAQQLPPRPAAA
jgi:squalene-associated FAD-dependent desaturase